MSTSRVLGTPINFLDPKQFLSPELEKRLISNWAVRKSDNSDFGGQSEVSYEEGVWMDIKLHIKIKHCVSKSVCPLFFDPGEQTFLTHFHTQMGGQTSLYTWGGGQTFLHIGEGDKHFLLEV